MNRLQTKGLPMNDIELNAVPEGKMHSFSLVETVSGNADAATFANIKLADGNILTLDYAAGKFTVAVNGQTIDVAASIAEKTLVALNYTYASGILDLTVYEGESLVGAAKMTDVKIEPVEFTIPESELTLSEAMIYRSALSAEDVENLAKGQLQKGSLEIYSAFEPVTENSSETVSVTNHAMSMNAFTMTVDSTSGIENISSDSDDAEAKFYTIDGLEVAEPIKGQLYIKFTGTSATKIIW